MGPLDRKSSTPIDRNRKNETAATGQIEPEMMIGRRSVDAWVNSIGQSIGKRPDQRNRAVETGDRSNKRRRRRHGSLKGAPIKRADQVKGDVAGRAIDAILASPHAGAATPAPASSGCVTARQHEDECFRRGRRVFTPADARAPTRAARSRGSRGSRAHRSVRRDAARIDVTKSSKEEKACIGVWSACDAVLCGTQTWRGVGGARSARIRAQLRDSRNERRPRRRAR